MTKNRDRVARDDDAPAVLVEDATERHLVHARQLLREARSRLSARHDGADDSNRNPETRSGDGEGSSD